MNTKKILFALAVFGVLALATYTPNNNSEEPTKVERKAINFQGKQ